MIREASERQRKNTNEMRLALQGVCKVPDCKNHLTFWKGPGEKDYCDKHQRNFKEFGGLAVMNKTYSHIRRGICEDCGFTPAELPRVAKYKDSDPAMYNRIIRTLVTVDHIDGNHENHLEYNLRELCHNCHNLKTIENGDNLTPSNQNK